MKTRVVIEICCVDRHCSNECPFIEIDHMPGSSNEYIANCELFGEVLEWNRRRKHDGYRRCGQCRHAELPSKRRIDEDP